MSRLGRWLVITFLESLASTMIERGVFFYSQAYLGFTDGQNLGLAVSFGAAYVAGALSSHALAVRLKEKRLLWVSIVGQMLFYAALFAQPGSWALVVGNVLLGYVIGVKWPVIESYVCAGRTPAATIPTIGRFNLAWVTAWPVALAVTGPLLAWWPRSLFAAAAMVSVGSLFLMRPMAGRPDHLPLDHPDRPAPGVMHRYRALLVSSRWSLVVSYMFLWVLSALMPRIFADLNVGVSVSPALSGVLDGVRGLTFLALQIYLGWHNRVLPLVGVVMGLPAGFLMILFGPNLATVLLGELVFGASAGMAYYAALYYAMVVKNAAVEAGGGHESLIGVGLVIGPLAALLGGALGPALGNPTLGMAVGVAPLVIVGAGGAVWSLLGLRRRTGPAESAD
ncbi:MAG TPA: hypothetical protein VMY69_00275 [Phycisphaerae bacterium]|nr:hypothetical protein [Phycisphaerae bacterium]